MTEKVISRYLSELLYEKLSQSVTGIPTKMYANFSVFTKIVFNVILIIHTARVVCDS